LVDILAREVPLFPVHPTTPIILYYAIRGSAKVKKYNTNTIKNTKTEKYKIDSKRTLQQYTHKKNRNH